MPIASPIAPISLSKLTTPAITLMSVAPLTPRAALLSLWKSLGGSDEALTGGSSSIGDWKGVQLDSSGAVVSLIWNHSSLSGSLPPRLGFEEGLASLKLLWLHGNDLQGSLPLALPVTLETLWIHSNPRLTGAVPASFASLENLKYFFKHNTGLDCPRNDLRGLERTQAFLKTLKGPQEGVGLEGKKKRGREEVGNDGREGRVKIRNEEKGGGKGEREMSDDSE